MSSPLEDLRAEISEGGDAAQDFLSSRMLMLCSLGGKVPEASDAVQLHHRVPILSFPGPGGLTKNPTEA